jgi:hypothetical protein
MMLTVGSKSNSTNPAGSGHDAIYPLEHGAGYVASVAGVGAVFGFLAWLLFSLILPRKSLDIGRWTGIGGGFAGAIALIYVVSNAVLY